MNIAVDAFPLTAKTYSGIPTYLKNTLLNLIQIDRENKYFVYCRIPFKFQRAENLTFRFSPHASESSSSYGNTLWLFTKGAWMMKKDKINIFWGTRHMIPPSLPKNIKKVLTVHDIVWHYYPGTMSHYNRLIMKTVARGSIRRADRIIAVSKSTADSICELMGVPRWKISVVYNAVNQYQPVQRGKATEYITKKYSISPDYALTISTIEPRKNLELLLKVFSLLKEKNVKLQLVVGGVLGWKYSYIKELYLKLGLTESRVKFLGYIGDQDMAYLYSAASIFLFPSRYEGFGIPPLEAMACGVPVISSNKSSLPEVIGNAGILLNPDDVHEWFDAIIKLVNDTTKREEMARKGIERTKVFSWEKSAEETIKVFQSLC